MIFLLSQSGVFSFDFVSVSTQMSFFLLCRNLLIVNFMKLGLMFFLLYVSETGLITKYAVEKECFPSL